MDPFVAGVKVGAILGVLITLFTVFVVWPAVVGFFRRLLRIVPSPFEAPTFGRNNCSDGDAKLIQLLASKLGVTGTDRSNDQTTDEVYMEKKGILALPVELGIHIFQYLDKDQKSLQATRRVCRCFHDLASPVLFKYVHFERTPQGWKKLYTFCGSPHFAKHARHLAVCIGKVGVVFPLPPSGMQNLKIESLKIYDYRCLLSGDVRLPIETQSLTTLHIDTRGLVRNRSATLADRGTSPEASRWRPVFSGEDLCNLRDLTISQNGHWKGDLDRAEDVVFLLQACRFKNLRNLKLHFLMTRPEHLVSLIRSCDRNVLTYVRIYRPLWSPDELVYLGLQKILTELKEDNGISFDGAEPWKDTNWTEEEISFMVDNDIVPAAFDHWASIGPGESEALDRYNEKKTGRNLARKRRWQELLAARTSVYDPLPPEIQSHRHQ
ncbi:MAG: hypothetical protein Q9218_005329 [Villophora microphyllina]